MLAAPQLSAPALAQDAEADGVVATVNGQPITLGQMIVMRQSMADPNFANLPDRALWDMMLDQLIRQTAVAAAGQENAGVRAQLELQRRNTLASAAVAEMAEAEPTDDEIRAAYDRMFAETEPVTEYNAAHILVETEEAAQAARARLEAGEEFGDVAEQLSTGPSGPDRGDLGWFTPDQMVEPFAEAVRALEPGSISEPVQTQFGWHVIKLNETRLREAPALDEVRDQIAQMVLRQRVEAEIERIVGEAQIERVEDVDPGRMNQVDLLEAE